VSEWNDWRGTNRNPPPPKGMKTPKAKGRMKRDDWVNPDPVQLIRIRIKCLKENPEQYLPPTILPVNGDEYMILREFCESINFPFIDGEIMIDGVMVKELTE